MTFDFSKIPFGGKLPAKEQEQFERRALALDDNDEPPVIIDKDGNRVEIIDEE